MTFLSHLQSEFGRYVRGATVAAALTAILTGCGGGGNGSGGTGGGTPPPPDTSVTVSGTVTDSGTGKTLAGRTVELTEQGLATLTSVTNSSGGYTIADVPAGTTAILEVWENNNGVPYYEDYATSPTAIGTTATQVINITFDLEAGPPPPPFVTPHK